MNLIEEKAADLDLVELPVVFYKLTKDFDPKEIFFVGMAIERVMAYHR